MAYLLSSVNGFALVCVGAIIIQWDSGKAHPVQEQYVVIVPVVEGADEDMKKTLKEIKEDATRSIAGRVDVATMNVRFRESQDKLGDYLARLESRKAARQSRKEES